MEAHRYRKLQKKKKRKSLYVNLFIYLFIYSLYTLKKISNI